MPRVSLGEDKALVAALMRDRREDPARSGCARDNLRSLLRAGPRGRRRHAPVEKQRSRRALRRGFGAVSHRPPAGKMAAPAAAIVEHRRSRGRRRLDAGIADFRRLRASGRRGFDIRRRMVRDRARQSAPFAAPALARRTSRSDCAGAPRARPASPGRPIAVSGGPDGTGDAAPTARACRIRSWRR